MAAALGQVAEIELVASTNSPHMQASPPITKSCCALLPYTKVKLLEVMVCNTSVVDMNQSSLQHLQPRESTTSTDSCYVQASPPITRSCCALLPCTQFQITMLMASIVGENRLYLHIFPLKLSWYCACNRLFIFEQIERHWMPKLDAQPNISALPCNESIIFIH